MFFLAQLDLEETLKHKCIRSLMLVPTPLALQCAAQRPSIWSLEAVSLRALPTKTGKLIGAWTLCGPYTSCSIAHVPLCLNF